MKVLFDQGTPIPLRRALAEHEVLTVFQLGWNVLDNAALLAGADGRFDVLITTDRYLAFPQTIQGRQLAVVVLTTSNWRFLRQHAAAIAAGVSSAKPGEVLRMSPGQKLIRSSKPL